MSIRSVHKIFAEAGWNIRSETRLISVRLQSLMSSTCRSSRKIERAVSASSTAIEMAATVEGAWMSIVAPRRKHEKGSGPSRATIARA